jgi:propionyl-CoA synthetase
LVLKAGGVRPADEVEREAVAGLPKTRSGKILRGTMRKIAEGAGYPLPATIDDSAVLAEIDRAFAAVGYAKR